MSRQNKVNKGNYEQAGRLTPDDVARERIKQRQVDHEIENKGEEKIENTAHEKNDAARTFTVRGEREQGSNRGRSAPEE